MPRWQVNQARNHWSDVLDQAESQCPQIITHHGKERAVVLSIEAYRSLQPETETPDFITYLLAMPKIELEDWEIERDRSLSNREVDL